ncbi:MAG: class I SAM-dependent methyltransferase [Verrucomicrobiales bacterium]|nr:class I SAM-dependent methyltransferase [Verrucomicrobiales bacterium]
MELEQHCRSCSGSTFELINFGDQPLANDLSLSIEQGVTTFPLAVRVCDHCALAQLSYCVDKEILYSDYNYITPESDELTRHYADIHSFLKGYGYLSTDSHVLDIGSNIGRLLAFLKPHVRSILGVDPARNVVDMAIDHEIPTFARFFNRTSAREIEEFSGRKDVIFARHCFAHNEDPGQILEGVPDILAKDGVLVIENAYFRDTVEKGEFDQVYHEHMYYYTLRGLSGILENYGLKLVDVHHSDVHGGTMMFVAKYASSKTEPSQRVREYLAAETEMHTPEYYEKFVAQIWRNRTDIRHLVDELRAEDNTIHAYGASAKATTLLNYFGLTDLQIPYVVDFTPTKLGKYIPLANIKVISEEEAAVSDPPDYYLLTIWNYRDEIIRKVRESGNTHTKFILPHPTVQIVEDPVD